MSYLLISSDSTKTFNNKSVSSNVTRLRNGLSSFFSKICAMTAHYYHYHILLVITKYHLVSTQTFKSHHFLILLELWFTTTHQVKTIRLNYSRIFWCNTIQRRAFRWTLMPRCLFPSHLSPYIYDGNTIKRTVFNNSHRRCVLHNKKHDPNSPFIGKDGLDGNSMKIRRAALSKTQNTRSSRWVLASTLCFCANGTSRVPGEEWKTSREKTNNGLIK